MIDWAEHLQVLHRLTGHTEFHFVVRDCKLEGIPLKIEPVTRIVEVRLEQPESFSKKPVPGSIYFKLSATGLTKQNYSKYMFMCYMRQCTSVELVSTQ